MKVNIRQQTGNYNLADPSEKSTEVYVEIPECDFEHLFHFIPIKYDLTFLPWDEALEAVLDEPHNYVGQKDRANELDEILEEHREEIRESWKEHRIEILEQELDQLKGV